MNFLCGFTAVNGEWFEIFRISIKATHQEALGFYMFHCFNISKYISMNSTVSHNFCLMYCVFCWIFENNYSGGGVTIFSSPGVRVSHCLCAQGETRPFKKIPLGMVRLGIDWYITAILSFHKDWQKTWAGACTRIFIYSMKKINISWLLYER